MKKTCFSIHDTSCIELLPCCFRVVLMRLHEYPPPPACDNASLFIFCSSKI